jgi:serine/threonine protein phosphatase PrpC
MSQDHKPDQPTERDRIQRAGCIIVEGRVNGNINLSRSIGDFEYKNNAQLDAKSQAVTAFPDVQDTELTSDDKYLILACDGIWDVLSN